MYTHGLGVCYADDYNLYTNSILTTSDEVADEIELISGIAAEDVFNDAATVEKSEESMRTESLGVCYSGDCNFYVNGICTTPGAVAKVADEIRHISGTITEDVFNDAATVEKIVEVAAMTVIGLSLIVYSVVNMQKKVTVTDVLVGLVGSVFFAWGVYDFDQIQKRTLGLGQELADKVRVQHGFNPQGRIALILHSQGADVGQIAVNLLGEAYHPYIHIINLGGKTHFSGNFASVHNFEYERDLIVRTATYFDMRNVTQLSGTECESLLCHDVKSYLKNSFVRAAIANTQKMAPRTFLIFGF